MRLVLIVEDTPFERELMRRAVTEEGYTCVEAGNGREALARIREERPDCILTDLGMPEMDGFELLAALQEDGLRVPVVVVTADRQQRTRDECLRLGAVEVLHKPWARRLLVDAVRKALAAADSSGQ